MARAYAALVSLIHVLNRVQHPTCPVSFDKSQIHSLSDKVYSLVDFLEAYSHKTNQDLERAMADAAFAAEDLIESYLVGRILKRSTDNEEGGGRSYTPFSQDLDREIQNMDPIIQDAMKVKEKFGGTKMGVQLPGRSSRFTSSVSPRENVEIVGFEDELDLLINELIARPSSRKLMLITGMGGIGKSTLTRSVYDHSYVRGNFNVIAWVSISEDFSIGKTIGSLLRDFGVKDVDQIGDEQLGVQLYQFLRCRKYFIILDDIWDIKAWDAINRFFPTNKNRSVVLLTTRTSTLLQNDESCSRLELKLLDDIKSLKLLYTRIFGQKDCPPGLKRCGENIVKSCKGLPLALVVIGGLLKASDMTLTYWEHVEKNIRSMISEGDDEHCSKVLSVSYHQLPIHLKPCFLHLGTYPEDYDIDASEIINLWAADGFLRPSTGSTLEEVASKCLDDLISRNLILVKKRGPMGNLTSLTVHDVIRDLCIREARQERFFHVDGGVVDSQETIENQRRLVADTLTRGMQQKRLARSFIWFRKWNTPPSISCLGLLRVFASCYRRQTLDDIAQLVNLRFLKFSMNEFMLLAFKSSIDEYPLSFFSALSLLWNLETLIVDVAGKTPDGYSLPCEIWKLRHLRHLVFSKEVILPDPPTDDSDFVFENLQTLKMVRILSDKALSRISNVKELGVFYAQKEQGMLLPWSGNLVQCGRLETLKFSACSIGDLKSKKFPDSLRELTLCRCRISWDNMEIVGSLPNLEVLRIGWVAFTGQVWNTNDEEFANLKLLSIEECDLVTWIAEDPCFPSLEHLSLRDMWGLNEIPVVFRDSMTIESFLLENCTMSAIKSAKDVQDYHKRHCNDIIKVEVVHILESWDDTPELKRELQELAGDKFHVKFERMIR